MKSTQFVCKETSATSQLDEVVVATSRYSDSYGHADRETIFQRHSSFLEDRASFARSGGNEKDLFEVSGLMTPHSSSKVHKTCLNIPKVDFSTFSPLLGTKFFCFHPCNFANVSDEIVTYLTHPSANVTFDLDDVNHVWKCQENVDFESATFTIALFEDSTKDKIFVKFHRLGGSCGVFSSSVERFSRLACVSSELKQVNPTDLSETKVTVESIKESSSRKRKGAFKALPLPLTMVQKSISCSEFVSYCEIFNLWSHSDIPECLASLLSSMPKMWKDLLAFYETVEKNPSSESMAELVTMFASINRIYKNLCSIAVQSHNSLQSGVATVTSALALASLEQEVSARSGGSPVGRPSAVMIADPSAPADYMGHSHDPHSYDYLDFDDVDTSAGMADDHMYGMHAASNNHAHRASVTVSQYRAMSVFDRSEFTAVSVEAAAGKNVESAAAPAGATYEINLNAKSANLKQQTAASGNNDSMYSKLLQGGTSPSSQTTHESTPEYFAFADLLSQLSKEDLSSILYLSVACISQQFSCSAEEAEGVDAEPSFDMMHYLTRLLQSNQEFLNVLQEIGDSRLPVTNSYGSFRSKDIKLYANQLNSILL